MTTLRIFVATGRGVTVAEHDGAHWPVTLRTLAGYRVTSLTARKGLLLAGTTKGIFRSDDQGQDWQPSNEGLTERRVRWLAGQPDMSDVAFAGTEPAAIFVSQDRGQSWQERPEVAQLRDKHGWYLPYSPAAGCVRGFALHGSRGYAAVEQGGLLRSDDSGQTWRLVEGSSGLPRTPATEAKLHPDVHSVAVHPASPDVVFAATGGGLYRSKDGGASWKRLYRCYCRAVWPDPADPDHLIFGPADSVDTNGRIEETTDGGQSWQPYAAGLEVPWPEHMVERFTQAGDQLLAVLSNGRVFATSLTAGRWQHILPDVTDANAIVSIEVE